jgi:hypothetical protein
MEEKEHNPPSTDSEGISLTSSKFFNSRPYGLKHPIFSASSWVSDGQLSIMRTGPAPEWSQEISVPGSGGDSGGDSDGCLMAAYRRALSRD